MVFFSKFFWNFASNCDRRYRFFYYYKDIAGAIYPVLEDVRQFQNTLELLMQNRTASGGVYREDVDEAQSPFGVSIAYLGLLFAVLASGCQSSDLGSKERELTSQVYGMFSRDSFAVAPVDLQP